MHDPRVARGPLRRSTSLIISSVQRRSLSGVKKAVAGVVANRPEVLAAYVFGSTASGRARPTSDVDVGVLVSRNVMRAPSKYRLNLMADLGAALRTFDVDVVLLNSAPPALAHNVVCRGTVVSERSHVERVRFQVRTLNRFLDTQPIRDVALERLKRRYRAR